MGKTGSNWVKWGQTDIKDSDKHGQTKSNVVKWGQTESNMVKRGPNGAKRGQTGSSRTRQGQTGSGPNGTIMGQIVPNMHNLGLVGDLP